MKDKETTVAVSGTVTISEVDDGQLSLSGRNSVGDVLPSILREFERILWQTVVGAAKTEDASVTFDDPPGCRRAYKVSERGWYEAMVRNLSLIHI